MNAKQTVMVNEFTNGVLDPGEPMLGPVRDGGRIVVNTAAGCWGPMLTPSAAISAALHVRRLSLPRVIPSHLMRKSGLE